MSVDVGKVISLVKKLTHQERALVAFYLGQLDSEQDPVLQAQPVNVHPSSSKPVSKTTAWRQRKAAETGSTAVSNGSATVSNGFQNVPNETGGTFHGTENGTGETFHGTPGTHNARIRALSLSPSSSEKTSEKESTGARASAGGTADGTADGTVGGTRRGTNGETANGTRFETAGGTLTAKAEAVRVALTEGFKSRGIIVPARSLSVPHSREVIDIARSVEPADLPKLIEGFFADPDAMKKGYPPAWLATNPAQYMPKTSAATAGTAGRPSNLTDHEHHALNREEAVARGERVKGPDPMHLASAKAKIAAAQQARAS